MVEVARRQLGEPGGEADRRLRPEAEVTGGIGQDAKLALGGGDDALMAVAGVDAPEAGEAVDERAPLGVGHGRALGGGEQADAGGFVPAPAGDRMDEMGAVELDQRVGKHGRSPLGSAERLGGEGEGLELASGGRRPAADHGDAAADRGEPLGGEPVAEAARLRRVDAEEGAGAAGEQEGEQAPGVGGVAGDDRARHLAAAEGPQRRVAREAAAVADDREAAGAGERRDEARAVHAGGGAVEGGDGLGVAGLGPGDALRRGDGGDRALLLDDAMRLDEAELP